MAELMGWFPTWESCAVWNGPGFRFPFTSASFIEDSKLQSFASFVLINEAGAAGASPLAFGQYYLRAGRCHLARLVTAPTHRSRGLGTQLIHSLEQEGMRVLGIRECSLFVSRANPRALALYERLGFERMPYPEPGAMNPNSHYMVAHRSLG